MVNGIFIYIFKIILLFLIKRTISLPSIMINIKLLCWSNIFFKCQRYTYKIFFKPRKVYLKYIHKTYLYLKIFLKVRVNVKSKVCWEVILDSQLLNLKLCSSVVTNYTDIGKLQTMANVSVTLKVSMMLTLKEALCIPQGSLQENQGIKWAPTSNTINKLSELNHSRILRNMLSQFYILLIYKTILWVIKVRKQHVVTCAVCLQRPERRLLFILSYQVPVGMPFYESKIKTTIFF